MQIMTKHQYNLNAAIMSVAGLIAFSAGLFMLLSPKQEVDPLEIKREKFTICQSAASQVNMSAAPNLKGNVIEVQNSDISNFKYTLAAASYLVSECEGFVMKEICMGESCTPKGFNMKLSYSTDAKQAPSELKVKLNDLIKKK